MANYYINEGAFALPDLDFSDRTMHVLEAELPSGRTLGFLVGRGKIEEGKTLRDKVAEHLLHDAKRLAGFAILDENETLIAGAPAIEIRSRWRYEGSVYYQRQAHVAHAGAWLLFAMTSPISEQNACDEHLGRVLGTLALRDDL